ncbi:uncharacterized protein LOC105213809 [Zeugodacus cucurbitae]|uniref:30S ribosomal protein S15 n=1 Tax=Zeugodacus cucurbitae TaxID=28588 RepID=A0A0A1XA31_ZEUCU|nr:uncharacterized protein LOC105213809 [Zeugodacus cucurbitae]
MHYISSVLCLLSLAQLPVFNNGEPLFGNENVHIKVHVPGASIDCEPANKITHPHHHQQHKHHKYPSHKPVRPQLRHNQFDDLLENILLSEFESPTINTHLDYTEHTDDINEHLPQHTEGYKSDYGKVVDKRPENFVKTYKIIEYKEPIISKNIYPTQQRHKHQHKPKTHNELYRVVESKYLPSTAEEHELHNTNHYQYPIRTQTKSTKPHTNSKATTYLTTANDYNGFKSAHKTESSSYNDANSDPHVAFKPNTNIYLPPYETPVSSVDQTDTVAYNVLTPKDTLSLPKETEPLFSSADSSPLDDFQPNTNVYLPPYQTPAILGAAHKFLTPKETLSLPTKEAEDFHGQFKSPTFNDGHFKPFIGDKYLPVGGESSITQAAAETYTGIDSYSASHVQGLDHHSHSPYRRWSTLI